ncbi:serine-rich aggregation substance UasX [Leuconostoc mesenteroides]|uniref:serine-rich aggregation substance UasX n=1 Tax=Leuconostoc mesenteroides TaxID=1245 RepID=UPI001CBB86C1|nr:serine-rich aggregation substance UasX [Leuconostoc mesenteroides]MBZ1513261.1 serine-rich aggregation substance UasX [Leuconostoc mesenteroides]
MLQKQLLIAGSVLGALALGHQAVSADTVPTTTDTSTAQSVQATTKALPQVKAVVLSATTDVVSDASSTVDDGTTVDNGGTSKNDGTTVDNGGSSSSSDNDGSGSSSDNNGGDSSSDNGGSGSSSDNNGGGSSSDNGGSGSSSDNNGSGSSSTDDGTTVDNGGSSSSSDNGGSNSSSDNSSSSSSDNGGSSSSSDNNGSSSNGGGTDSSTTGGNGSNNTVPLTPTTPDTNNQGEANHVKPVEVTTDNSGNVVDVPTQVASVPSVARAVEAYNQALTANDKDATKAPVVEAKQKLDDAVAKALPLTHATEKSSMGGNGILALAMSGLVALGGLIYKRKHL